MVTSIDAGFRPRSRSTGASPSTAFRPPWHTAAAPFGASDLNAFDCVTVGSSSGAVRCVDMRLATYTGEGAGGGRGVTVGSALAQGRDADGAGIAVSYIRAVQPPVTVEVSVDGISVAPLVPIPAQALSTTVACALVAAGAPKPQNVVLFRWPLHEITDVDWAPHAARVVITRRPRQGAPSGATEVCVLSIRDPHKARALTAVLHARRAGVLPSFAPPPSPAVTKAAPVPRIVCTSTDSAPIASAHVQPRYGAYARQPSPRSVLAACYTARPALQRTAPQRAPSPGARATVCAQGVYAPGNRGVSSAPVTIAVPRSSSRAVSPSPGTEAPRCVVADADPQCMKRSLTRTPHRAATPLSSADSPPRAVPTVMWSMPRSRATPKLNRSIYITPVATTVLGSGGSRALRTFSDFSSTSEGSARGDTALDFSRASGAALVACGDF